MTMQLIACLLLCILTGSAAAATHGHGHVEIRGSIIDTACAISTGDADQSISLGTLSANDLMTNEHGPSVPFTVHLVNCVLNGEDNRGYGHWKDVRIVFDGEVGGPGLFALQGDARGEALAISDEAGIRAEPGKALDAGNITSGDMALHYRMWLTGDHRALRPGRLYTTVRYFMEYD
ncbi:TPA: type 1 fimbrial protein [Klebsiella oxytoca]|nr:type 1 fimbrial protein [Klebsiella oxytoca]